MYRCCGESLVFLDRLQKVWLRLSLSVDFLHVRLQQMYYDTGDRVERSDWWIQGEAALVEVALEPLGSFACFGSLCSFIL